MEEQNKTSEKDKSLISIAIALIALVILFVAAQSFLKSSVEESEFSELEEKVYPIYFYVHYDKLNIREEPNTNSKILGQLEKGNYIPVFSVDSVPAWRIYDYEGIRGWVFEEALGIDHPDPFFSHYAILNYTSEQLIALKSVISPILDGGHAVIDVRQGEVYVNPNLWNGMSIEIKEGFIKNFVLYANIIKKGTVKRLGFRFDTNNYLFAVYDWNSGIDIL